MIPEAAVEAAEEYLSLLMADPNGDYTVDARAILEAAAPHMLARAEVAHSEAVELVLNVFADRPSGLTGEEILDALGVIRG